MLSKRYRNNGIPIIKLNSIQLNIKKKIELQLKRGIYKFESVPCCICNKKDFEDLSGKDRYGFNNPVVICKNCGLIQNNPRMNQESYKNFYETEYRNFIYGEFKSFERNFKNEYNRGREIFKFLKDSKILDDHSKDYFIFEVGCGSGGILQVFKEKGFRVQGCDLDKNYVKFGKINYGLDIDYGTLEDILFKKTPDLIIYSHVLEHILFPKKELNLINQVLNKDGYLFIAIPGIKNLVDVYNSDFLFFIQNAHVYYFSLITLQNLLSLNGFQLIKGNYIVKSIFKKSETSLPEYAFKNDYNAVMRYLKRLEKSRKLLLLVKLKKKIIQLLKINFKNYGNLKSISLFILKYLLQRYVYQISLFKNIVYKILQKLER